MKNFVGLLVSGLLTLPALSFGQVNFDDEFAGYSWTHLAAFNPDWAAVDMAFLPDGNILVAQQTGLVRAWSPTGAFLGTVLDIKDEVCQVGDSGLTSILLDSDFPATPRLYLLYAVETDPENPDTTLKRFGRITSYELSAASNYLSVVPESRKILLGEIWSEGILHESTFHATGNLQWGDDGSLLFSAGDAADFGYKPTDSGIYGPDMFDPSLNIRSLRAQSLDCYNAKICRIDKETGLGLPTNPFFTGNADDPQSRIWALGLRNPWRFSVREGTGEHTSFGHGPGILWIGDVGLDSYEEINITSKEGGENFGWPFYEGSISPLDKATYDGPIDWLPVEDSTTYSVAISHDLAKWNGYPEHLAGEFEVSSITAGFFYDYKTQSSFTDDSPVPYTTALDGKYMFAGWTNHDLYLADVDSLHRPVDIKKIASGDLGVSYEGIVNLTYNPADGNIYALTYWHMYRLDFDPTGSPPVANLKATPDIGPLPLEISLDASGSYDPAGKSLKTYTWDFDDGTTAVTATSTINHNFTEDRNYNVSVVVISQNDRKDTATVTVYPGNIPPTAVIKQPSPAMSYPDDGSPKTIYYLGEVADEDGPTPEARWRVALRHNDHRHELAETIGLDGEFTVRHEEENTFYLFELIATDDRGYSVLVDRGIYRESETTATATATGWNLYE